MSDFRVIYELTLYDAIFSGGALRILIGLAIVYFLVQRGKSLGPVRIFLWLWAILWLAGHIPFYIRDIRYAANVRAALNSNQCKMAEGDVKVLHRQPSTGHSGGDKIQVGGSVFEVDYFDYSVGPTYHKTIAYGGELRQGVYARIYSYRGRMVKIEIGL